ncbi:hypothetical protein FRB98_002450, partial [Tulasnella sp. 332]
MLYGSLAAPEQIVYIPVNVEDAEKYPSIIPVNYLCRLEQQKSAGSIFVAVSVATLTLFKSGWAVFLLILGFLAKREQPEDALTGYETVPGTSQDYNYVPNRWYQRFAPRPTPGSYCDSYKFTIGDSFVTNSSILTYQLAAVLGDKEGSGAVSSIDYKGTSLQNCDVSTISVAADVRTETSTIMAEIACTSETDFPVIFTTSIVYSWFRDRLHSTSGRQENYQIGNMRAFNPLGMAVSALVEAGANDLIQYTLSVFENTANSPAFYNVPSLNSSDYPTWWCPVTTTTANSTCKTAIPEISLGDTTFLYANGTPAKGDGYASAATNAMNAMLPAVRIDLGNILPTNMLINRSLELINTTIVPTFPATISYNSTLYNTLTMAPAPDSTLAKIGDTEQYSSIIP